MRKQPLVPGQAYRLLTNFEVHDEHTGTMRAYALKGTVLKIKRVAAEQNKVWIEGYNYAFPLNALELKVTATD